MNDWLANEGARGQVTRLLEEAGVPLEIRVLRMATRFSSENDDRKLEQVSDRGIPTYSGRSVTAEPIVYESNEGEIREIDCFVKIYEEYAISDWVAIQHILEIPIECKMRKDVAVFGIRDDSIPSRKMHFPVVSFLARSRLGSELSKVEVPAAPRPSTAISFLEIKDGSTPAKMHKENLLYNAGASLYDFVRFSMDETALGPWGPTLKDLVNEFINYVTSKHYSWPTSIYPWMDENITVEHCTEFLYQRHGGSSPSQIHYGLTSWLPVVCLGSQLYEAIPTDTGALEQFEETPCLLAGLRLPGWRQAARKQMLRRSPEAPLVATNEYGLSKVLEMGRDWFLAQKDCLMKADASLVQRALLETAFVQAVADQFAGQRDPGYRSDLDMWDWVHSQQL